MLWLRLLRRAERRLSLDLRRSKWLTIHFPFRSLPFPLRVFVASTWCMLWRFCVCSFIRKVIVSLSFGVGFVFTLAIKSNRSSNTHSRDWATASRNGEADGDNRSLDEHAEPRQEETIFSVECSIYDRTTRRNVFARCKYGLVSGSGRCDRREIPMGRCSTISSSHSFMRSLRMRLQ